MKHIQLRNISVFVLFTLLMVVILYDSTSLTFAQSSTTIGSGLSVTCKPSVASSTVGNTVTWSAIPTGGNGVYTYQWGGSQNLTGSNSSVTMVYPNEVAQTATVTVISNGQRATTQCSSVDVREQVVSGWCGVRSVINADGTFSVNWDSSVRTLATTTTYQWSGTDGLSGSSAGVQKIYTTPGLKQAQVIIHTGNQTLNFTCSADVRGVENKSGVFGASCLPVINNMTIDWNGTATGGLATSTYSWTGTDGLSTTTSFAEQIYTTEGTKTATVAVQSGSQSMTLSCQARIASTTSSGGHCFIATAAYGTPLEPEVMVLRHFRDKALLPHLAGQIFVRAYYAVSPPIAEFIRDREPLKAVVRAGLEPIIYGLEKAGYTE